MQGARNVDEGNLRKNVVLVGLETPSATTIKQLIMDQAPSGVRFITGNEDELSQILEANKPFVLFWQPKEQLSPKELIPRLSQLNAICPDMWYVLVTTKQFSGGELESLTKSRLKAVLTPAADSQAVWNVWQSLEQCRWAEEANRQWQTILDQPLMGIVCIASDGTIRHWNRAMEELTNIPAREMVGQKIWDAWNIFFPYLRHNRDKKEKFKQGILQALQKGTLIQYPKKLEMKLSTGSRILLHHAVIVPYESAYQVISFFHDYTEQEEALKALRRSRKELEATRRMFQLMADNLPDMIWAKDLENRYLFANKTMCEKLLNARTPDEVVGKTDMYFAARERAAHPENPEYHTFGELCMDSDEEVKKARKPMQFDEFGNVKGKFMYLDVHKAPLFDENGKMIGTVGSARIVTREKKLEEERAQALEELKKYRDYLEDLVRARTADLEAFTYSVSHDLKAPIRSIIGFASIMQEECTGCLNSDKRRYLEILVKNSYKTERLIEGLLALYRVSREKIQLKTIDLGTVINEIIEELKVQNSQRQIHWHIAPLPEIAGHRTMIHQCFFNLLSNAVKYTTEAHPAEIRVSFEEKQDSYVFAIADNGIGFDPSYADRLFKPFQRLHSEEQYEGSGIGLAIVKRILDSHGASIWVESQPNIGTTFFIAYPKFPEINDKLETA